MLEVIEESVRLHGCAEQALAYAERRKERAQREKQRAAVTVLDMAREAVKPRRGKRIEALAKRFGWTGAHLAVIDRLIEAVEVGDFAGVYVAAQAFREKVDGTAKSHDQMGGSLDRERALADWYRAQRADWTAREVPWWGMIMVLVFGYDIETAEKLAGRRVRRYLAVAIDAEVRRMAQVAKLGVDKATRKTA